jgi:cytoskeletal protein CcmA (bactofilin family)
MFGGRKKKQNQQNSRGLNPAILSSGTLVRGDIYSEGVLVIEGVVEGSIIGNRVYVKPKGKVKGTVSCRSLVIEKGGIVNGSLKVVDTPSLSTNESLPKVPQLEQAPTTPEGAAV